LRFLNGNNKFIQTNDYSRNGVSGSGKTTIGKKLAESLEKYILLDFIDFLNAFGQIQITLSIGRYCCK